MGVSHDSLKRGFPVCGTWFVLLADCTTSVRLKLAFCTTCVVRVLVLAQGPSFFETQEGLVKAKGDSQDKGNVTITSGGVEIIQRSIPLLPRKPK